MRWRIWPEKQRQETPLSHPDPRASRTLWSSRLTTFAFLFIAVTFILGLNGFHGVGIDGAEAVFRTLQLFTLEFNLPHEAPVNTQLQWARFMAPVVLIAAIIKLLFDGLGFRLQWLGKVLLRRKQNRDIVIGFGQVGREIGGRLCQQGRCVTWIDRIEGSDETLRNARNAAERMGGILAVGNATERGWLDMVWVRRAERVFIALDDDLAGLEAAAAVRAQCAETRWFWQRPPRPTADIRMFTQSAELCEILPGAAAAGLTAGNDMRFFNLRAEAARKLVLTARWDRLALMLGQRRVHVVLAGCGEHGEALLREVLLLCHRAQLGAPLVTVVDRAPGRVRARIARQSPAVLHPDLAVLDWLPPRFIEADLDSVDLSGLDLCEDEAQSQIPVTAWAFCTEDDALNLRAALHLQTAMQTRKLDGAPIYARLWCGRQGRAEWQAAAGINQTMAFGSFHEGLDWTPALDTDPDCASKRLHWEYLKAVQKSPGMLGSADSPKVTEQTALKDWTRLSPSKQTASRQLHHHAAMKLDDLGFDWRGGAAGQLPQFSTEHRADFETAQAILAEAQFAGSATTPPEELSGRLLEAARNEHDRWTLDRAINGWQQDRVRDDERLRHPFMKPFDKLPPDIRGYDAVLLRALIDTSADDQPMARKQRSVWVRLEASALIRATAPLTEWASATHFGVILPANDLLPPDDSPNATHRAAFRLIAERLREVARGENLCRLAIVFLAPPTPQHLKLAENLTSIMREHRLEVQTVWAWCAGPERRYRNVVSDVALEHEITA